MTTNATDTVIAFMRSNPTFVGEFCIDIAQDSDQYGDPEKDWPSAPPAEWGEAFLECWIKPWLTEMPELAELADVDLAQVDNEVVGAEVLELSMNAYAWDV